MKRFLILGSILLFAMLFLSLAGCGDSDKNDITGLPDITPQLFDWEIIIADTYGMQQKGNYMVNCYWYGATSGITDADVFSIKFGTQQPIALENYNLGGFRMIFGTADLTPATTYNVVFYKNNTPISTSSIKTPYRVATTFPNTYNPTQTAHLTWNLDANNQYQVLTVSAYNPQTDEDDDYDKNLDPSARSFTIPANVVENYGAGAEYTIDLAQANFTKSGRTAILAIQGNSQDYGTSNPTKSAKHPDLQKLAHKLIAQQ